MLESKASYHDACLMMPEDCGLLYGFRQFDPGRCITGEKGGVRETNFWDVNH